MKITLYYPDGEVRTVDHYNPKLRGVKVDGVRAQAIIIEMNPEDPLDEDFFLYLESACHSVHPQGYVGVERVG